MSKKDFILEIMKSNQTVFTAKEIALILDMREKNALKSKINYYVKKGVIKAVRRGIYVKPNYDIFELATKVYAPSYISLETVLQNEGVIFQYYEEIFVISNLSRKLEIDKKEIQIRKIKDEILLNQLGIQKKNNYSIATKERAFLDALYLYGDYYFDNVEILNKDSVLEMVKIYKQESLVKRVKKYFKNA
jgi:hypothetical protein